MTNYARGSIRTHNHTQSQITDLTAGGGTVGGISDVPGLQAALDAKQTLDSDLTAIAALATTSFGRSFLPLADAAAARTLTGSPIIYNVRTYGAVGDGVTDDQAAIQAAIDAAGAAGGGIVWLDAKRYLLSALKISTPGSEAHLQNNYSNIHIIGRGATLVASDAYSMIYQGSTTRFVNQTVRTLSGSYARGIVSLTLATAGQASNFAVGDYIYIRTGQTVDGLTGQPDAEINRVVSSNAGTGVIGLAWPTSKPYAQEYYVSGTTGKTTTSVTANLAPFGISNINSIIVTDQAYDGFRMEHAGTGTAYGFIGGQVFRCLVNGVSWYGNTGMQSVGAWRGYTVRDFHGDHPGSAGTYIYTLTADSGCTDGLWDGIHITGAHVVSVHIHEGAANVKYTNFDMAGPDTVSDLSYIDIRGRGYGTSISNGTIRGATPSALAVDPDCVAGGSVQNVQFLGESGYGAFIAAPEWNVTGLRHPNGAKFWALGSTGVDSELRYLSAWVTKDNKTVVLGRKPANAYVKQVSIQVTEAFNSNGTDTVSVGFVADNAGFAAATDVSTTGFKTPTLGGYAGYSPGDHGDIKAYYVAGGSAPSTGKAIVTFEYALIPESP